MILLKSDENLLYTAKDHERIDNEDNERQGHRDDFERDYGRIIHSSAFRRLQGKTQVFGPAEGDYHRTRLTHTLEVAQIARGIVIQLNNTSKDLLEMDAQIDMSLVEAAALAHDLGHPPFGHQGERALNNSMLKHKSGFEGNAHTFRLLTHLEGDKEYGLNLSRATLLAICKYPILFSDAYNIEDTGPNPPKANIFNEDSDTWQWLIKTFTEDELAYYTEKNTQGNKHFKTKHKTLECTIIELADDIAYATHDLLDVLKYNLLKLDDFKAALDTLENPSLHEEIISRFKNLKHTDSNFDLKLKTIIADFISKLIQDIRIEKKNDSFQSPRLKFKAEISPESKDIIELLSNKTIYEKVIQSQRLQTLEWRGGYIVEKLFDTLVNETKLLPNDKQSLIKETDALLPRIICDYIAGMTDKYAENLYRRLFESNGGRLFDL